MPSCKQISKTNLLVSDDFPSKILSFPITDNLQKVATYKSAHTELTATPRTKKCPWLHAHTLLFSHTTQPHHCIKQLAHSTKTAVTWSCATSFTAGTGRCSVNEPGARSLYSAIQLKKVTAEQLLSTPSTTHPGCPDDSRAPAKKAG